MTTQTTDTTRAESEYRSTGTIQQIADRLREARKLLVTTHVKPDGDGIGSALAIYRALKPRGVDVDIQLMGPLEPRLRDIAGDTPFRRHDGPPSRDDYDTILVLDTGAWVQLEPIADWLRQRHEKVIGVDHHARGDDVASMRYVDVTAASTTQVLVPILETMGCEISGGPCSVAEALFVGLATDTGWFKYSSADAKAMHLAARLLELGVDKPRLYQVIEETFRPQRLELEARALSSLEFACDGAVAIMALRESDFKETEGVVQDVSELVNVPMVVRTVRVSILLTQNAQGRTKLSFRSKPDVPGIPCPISNDMNKLAQRFGGGGHVHASGATIEADLDEAKRRLLEALSE